VASDSSRFGSPTQRLRVVGTSLGLGVAGFLVGIVVTLLLLSLLGGLGIRVQENIIVFYGVQTIGLQGVGLMATSLFYFQVRDRFSLVRIGRPSLRDVGLMLGGTVGIFLLFAGITVLYSLLGVQTPSTPIVEDGLQTPVLALYLIPLTYLLVGPGEELLFRGAIQGLLGEAYPSSLAVVIASAIFAVAHAGNVVGAPLEQAVPYFAILFVLSLVLGTLYEVSDNLLVPIFVHGTYNAVTFFQLYLRGSGAI
jgi:membrane protease YdiL (CAAX protease family)